MNHFSILIIIKELPAKCSLNLTFQNSLFDKAPNKIKTD